MVFFTILCAIFLAGLTLFFADEIKKITLPDVFYFFGSILLKIPYLKKCISGFSETIEKHSKNKTPQEFLGRAVVFGFVFYILGLVIFGDFFVAVFFALAGISIPYFALQSMKKKYLNEVYSSIPDFLDLLTLLVESGCDLGAALKIISSSEKGALYFELSRACDEIKFGKSRLEAISDVSKRVGEKNLTSVMSALIQSIRAGASIGKTLRMLSEQIRQERVSSIEKQISEAQVKIIFPMVLFIFPTIFLIIFGPLVLYFIR
ncbi:MAG: type II secretion system F family protein [Elusimicrobiota bacterium]